MFHLLWNILISLIALNLVRTKHFLVETKDKNVLAGTEYSGTAAAKQESLVFGNEVPEDKFTSCKLHGKDQRSLIIPINFMTYLWIFYL